MFFVAPTVTVYEKSGVTLTLSCEKQSDSGLTVTLTASNSTDSDISSFTLQAAVPKVCLNVFILLIILLIFHCQASFLAMLAARLSAWQCQPAGLPATSVQICVSGWNAKKNEHTFIFPRGWLLMTFWIPDVTSRFTLGKHYSCLVSRC